jgi:hypothetical protein
MFRQRSKSSFRGIMLLLIKEKSFAAGLSYQLYHCFEIILSSRGVHWRYIQHIRRPPPPGTVLRNPFQPVRQYGRVSFSRMYLTIAPAFTKLPVMTSSAFTAFTNPWVPELVVWTMVLPVKSVWRICEGEFPKSNPAGICSSLSPIRMYSGWSSLILYASSMSPTAMIFSAPFAKA